MSDLDIKPVAALSPFQTQQINDAIVDSFSPAELTAALRYKWGLVLGNYVNVQQPFYTVVADLISWADRRGKTRELGALAFAERPGNETVQRMADSLGLVLADVEQKYDLSKPQPHKPALEAMVAKHSRFIDYGQFLYRFRALGDRICRIETPSTIATGFLVGPNIMLTNFHVVEAMKTAQDASRAVCQFDFHDHSAEANEAQQNHGPTTCRLAPEWLLAKSPYSDSDLTGVGEPRENEFDYALVRLAESIGAKPAPTGRARGWFDIAAERPLLAVRDFVVVPQHAKGRQLEVAWGSVLSFTSLGTRMRYDATTDEGSSGSPCLSTDLDIFGLHHATDPKKNPQFNQAIPIDLIARDLKAKGVTV